MMIMVRWEWEEEEEEEKKWHEEEEEEEEMQAFYYKVRYEGQHINHGLAATLGHRPLDKHSSLSAKWTARTDGNVWWGELSQHSYRVSFIYIANPNNLPNSTNTALRIFSMKR